MKPAYRLVPVEDTNMEIQKVDVSDVDGLSWKDAKKALRKYFLSRATSLRSLTEKEFRQSGMGGGV